jgi:hypothetical protein
MDDDQNWQNTRLDFEGYDFNPFSFLFFLPYMYRNEWMLALLESLYFDLCNSSSA